MQSTAMVALRTTIMMVCLVAVPLAAVMGTALPRFLSSLLDGRGKTNTTGPNATTPGKRIAVAGNEPVSPSAPDETALEPSTEAADGRHPTARITAVRPAFDSPRAARADARPPDSPSPLAAATGTYPADAAPSVEQTAPFWSDRRRTAESSRPHHLKQGLRQTKLLKTGYSVGTDAGQETVRPLAKVERDARRPDAGAAPTNDPFATSEQRLRELGATYYRLESWGDHGDFYRCACDIRIGPRGRSARHFEAIEPTASEAVAAVIDQVERHSNRTRRRQ